MNNEEKGKYYDWLQREFQSVENEIMRVPKLTIEQQSKNVNMVEYSEENLKKIKSLRTKLSQIAQESEKLF
tara:strand:+ start:195 stop:407 length:213 start_codon:yes stop_codon:yes gene_type:complete